MTTSYPGAIDSLTNPTPSDPLNSATVPHAAQHANANDAIEAIQNTLGTNPQGTSATVKDRITAAEGVILNLNLAIDERVPGEAGSNAPTAPLPNGYVWVNTSTNAIKVWNGTAWVDPISGPDAYTKTESDAKYATQTALTSGLAGKANTSDLALKLTGTYATAQPASPVVGQVWVDGTYAVKVWNGSAWVNPSNAGSSGPSWAVASGGTESTFVANGSNGENGKTYKVHTFTGNGTLTISQAGNAEVFMISGGGATNANQSVKGTGGTVYQGLLTLSTGSLAVTIGAGGISRNATITNIMGKPSSLGSVNTGFSRCGDETGPCAGATDVASWATPLTSSFTGSAIAYGGVHARLEVPTPNRGWATNWNDDGARNGGTGVVIVRYQI